MDEVLSGIAASVSVLAGIADPAAGGRIEGQDAVTVVREALVLASRLTAIAARAVPVVEADGWWALEGGGRSITSWVAVTGRLSHGQARRVVHLGRAMRDDLPISAQEAIAGRIGVEAAHVMASVCTTPIRRAALAAPVEDCGEGFLVEHARELPVGQLRMLARRWAAHADPDADERGYREADEREFLDLADTTDGCHVTGFLTTEHGHALRAALDAMTDRTAEHAGQPAGRKRARALKNVVRTVLDRDLSGATGSHRPQITCVVDFETLRRAVGGARSLERRRADRQRPAAVGRRDCRAASGTSRQGVARRGRACHGRRHRDASALSGTSIGSGWLSSSEPVRSLTRSSHGSRATARSRESCSGPSRKSSTSDAASGPTPARKRRAIIARDRHCQFPQCDAPPAMSEVHHVEHWVRDRGETDVATGCFLCWAHHEHVHAAGVEIRRGDGGRWKFTDRHGQALRAP